MICHDLRALLRLAEGRREQPSAAIFDSRTLQSTPESGERAAARARGIIQNTRARDKTGGQERSTEQLIPAGLRCPKPMEARACLYSGIRQPGAASGAAR